MAITKSITLPNRTSGDYWYVRGITLLDGRFFVSLDLYANEAAKLDGADRMQVLNIPLPQDFISSSVIESLKAAAESSLVSFDPRFLGGVIS